MSTFNLSHIFTAPPQFPPFLSTGPPNATLLPMASSVTAAASPASSAGPRSRLPRWTRREILVLVQGKTAHERGAGTGPAGGKWEAVSAYCGRHGVERGPLQCRKRWSNLACDFKKVRRWGPSFWEMRSVARRERKLPGFFDREIYGLMEGGGEEEEEGVFGSGRPADAFSEDGEEEEEDNGTGEDTPLLVAPLSEKKYEPFKNVHSDPGNSNKQQANNNPEKGSSSWEGRKRRRTSEENYEKVDVENKIIEALEKNTKMISEHLEAHNISCQLDREQRKDQFDGLLAVLTKLADAIGRIADKL